MNNGAVKAMPSIKADGNTFIPMPNQHLFTNKPSVQAYKRPQSEIRYSIQPSSSKCILPSLPLCLSFPWRGRLWDAPLRPGSNSQPTDFQTQAAPLRSSAMATRSCPPSQETRPNSVTAPSPSRMVPLSIRRARSSTSASCCTCLS